MNKYIQQSEKSLPTLGRRSYKQTLQTVKRLERIAKTFQTHKELCPNCGGDIAIRNPTGHCDHLYYPENVPHKKHKNWENEFDRYFLDINAFVATDHSPFPCSSKVFDGKIAVKCFISQLLLSTQQEAVEEALAQRDDALIKKIKGMMKEVNDNSNIGEDTEFAYNEALYDVLSHLQETESKDIE